MNKIYVLILVALCLVSSVFAAGVTVNSNSSMEYNNGVNWVPATIVSYIHPSWTSYISIPGATWMWHGVNGEVTADSALNGETGQNFKQQFNLPTCAKDIQGSIVMTVDNAYDFKVNAGPVH